jgi:prevent-host-death family protein
LRVNKISATEAARGFAEILNRVRYQGEQYEIVRNGEPVARIVPVGPTRAMTARQLSELLNSLPRPDEGFLGGSPGPERLEELGA